MSRQLTKKEERILKLAAAGGTDKELVVLDEIEAIREEFNSRVSDILAAVPNLDTVLASVRGAQGDQGIHGEPGIDGERGPIGPQGERGPAGKDGRPGKDGRNGNDGSQGPIGPQGDKGDPGDLKDLAPEDIRNSLELLPEGEKLSQTAVEGLVKTIADLREELKKRTTNLGGGGGAADAPGAVLAFDLNTYGPLDGATKSFNIPAVWRIISIHSSSFPFIFQETADYTWTPTSILFTSGVDAATSLAAGQTITVLYAKA